MRNRTYGGVRGRKTKVGEKLLRFPPTRFAHVLNVVPNLTQFNFGDIKIIKHLVDLIYKVIYFVLPLKVTKAAVKNLIAQHCVLIYRHMAVSG